MNNPSNYTGDKAGYNTKMFSSERAVRRGFIMLGYSVNKTSHKVSESIVKKFQEDYNRCSKKFEQWGQIKVDGSIEKPTLNALEHAIRWCSKIQKKDGTLPDESWTSLCGREDVDKGDSEGPENTYVEILPNGIANIRLIGSDMALRADLIELERHGDVIFAIVTIPGQADLPEGRSQELSCPCVFRR